MIDLSLVIPCYNEDQSILKLAQSCVDEFKGRNVELILVDNGSTDSSQEVFKRVNSLHPSIKVLSLNKNQGYGGGILAGLNASSGRFLGWTHADLQTHPKDVAAAYDLLRGLEFDPNVFVKGKRYGRPLTDVVFTMAMSIFETILMGRLLVDINAQPTIFHRNFFDEWNSPPADFSLDLFALFEARKRNLKVLRIPVHFGAREFGVSSWNVGFVSKLRFISRTIRYSVALKIRELRS